MNMEAMINLVIQTLDASTEATQTEFARNMANVLADHVFSTATQIDDTLVKNIIVPNIDIFTDTLKERFMGAAA